MFGSVDFSAETRSDIHFSMTHVIGTLLVPVQFQHAIVQIDVAHCRHAVYIHKHMFIIGVRGGHVPGAEGGRTTSSSSGDLI